MRFDVKVCNQSESIGNTCQAFVFKHVHRASKKTNWMKLSGFPVGAVSGLLDVATRVSYIGEAALKGAINIVGSPFPNECSLKTGLSQIALEVPKNVMLLPFTMVGAIITLFAKTVHMARDPEQHSHAFWMDYDPTEKKQYQTQCAQKLRDADEQHETEARQADKNRFDELCLTLEESPDDIESMRAVAECYLTGVGVERDYSKAIDYYDRLVFEHGDQEAALRVFRLYSSGRDRDKAFEYAQKAADLGSVLGMLHCGLICMAGFNGMGADDAINWYTKAAEKGSEQAMSTLGKIYLTDTHWNTDAATKWIQQAADQGDQHSVGYLTALQEREGESKHRPYLDLVASPTAVEAYSSAKILIRNKENLEGFKQAILTGLTEIENTKQHIPDTTDPAIKQEVAELNKMLLKPIQCTLSFRQQHSPSNPKKALASLQLERPELDFTEISSLAIFQ